MAGRWLSCPFGAVEEVVPRAGTVLDVGCGHGLLACHLALVARDREVVGTDVDGRKVDVARRVAARAGARGARVRFEAGPPGHLPAGPWTAVTIVDVLYLLEPAAQRDLLTRAASLLAPGGVLVVKEMGRRPLWKLAVVALQETLSVRVLGITAGSGIRFTDPSDFARCLADAGLEVRSRAVDERFPHPHHLLVGTRPAQAAGVAPGGETLEV